LSARKPAAVLFVIYSFISVCEITTKGLANDSQQNFVDAYKVRVASLPSTSKCPGLTAQFDAQAAKLITSDEETQNYFGLEALLYCTGLNDLI
jgi:hypothetical protein